MSSSSQQPTSGEPRPVRSSQPVSAPDPESTNRPPAQAPAQAPASDAKPTTPAPRGRPAAAWTAVTLGVILAVLLVIFIAQNTQRVQLSFLGFDGSLPLAVALLAAAVVGAAVVLLVGTIRVTQLKLAERRLRRQQ